MIIHLRDLISRRYIAFFNEALIPVMYLINETSITQATPSEMSTLEYYHVELDTHEVSAWKELVESYAMVRTARISNLSNTSDFRSSVNPR
jgi:hypothetical protein